MTKLFLKIINRIRRFNKEFYKVPYCVPAWGLAEHLTILRCLLTGRIVKGNDKARLFDMVRTKTGKPYVFGYNSGREAIMAVLKTRISGPHDKVIMPSYCCETVAQAVVSSGASILFCDIGDDFNPDVDHILNLVDSDVKAIVFPHMFGNPGRIDLLEDALVKRNLRSDILVIDDAAQSFGARLNGKLVGTFGDAGIISFGPGKTMTATGGGLLITEKQALAGQLVDEFQSSFPLFKKLKKIVYWVVFRRWRRFSLPFYPFFQFLFKQMQGKPESIYSICNIDAAIGQKQLGRFEKLISKRMERKKMLDGLPQSFSSGLTCLPQNSQSDQFLNVATKYPFSFQASSSKNEIQQTYHDFLADRGIEMQSLYTPIHMKFPQNITFTPYALTKTEKMWDKVLHIPVEPSCSEPLFEMVMITVADFVHSITDKNNAPS